MEFLRGGLTSVAFCWRIERGDGAGLALTSHDEALPRGGVRFEAAPGIMPSAIERGGGIEASDGEVAGAISSDALDEEELTLGRWDGARVVLEAVDWNDPDGEALVLSEGRLGEVRLAGGEFQAELLGPAARLEEAICPETSPECRAELGDRQCRVDMAGRSLMAIVTAVEGTALALDPAVGEEFLWGRARFLSGANTGLVTAVRAFDGARIELRDLLRGEVAVGDRVELRHGCDKRFATCCERFHNAANFRGEPHLPGNDLLTRFPGA